MSEVEDGDGEVAVEELVAVEGVVRFSRSEGEDADDCLCCIGPHIHGRGIEVEPEPSRFPGLTKTHFSEWVSEALHEDRLEGHRVRVSLHLLPDSNNREEAGDG